ncbi:MAG TPA: hypothetical protein V6C69_08625, partial [Trichormus sp.]
MTRTEDPEDENLIHHPDTTANTTISPANPNCGTGFNGAPALFATPAPPLVQLAGADAVSVAKEQ